MEARQLRLGQVMRRPRWIALLVLALAVAAAFAALGRWQFERAVTSQAPPNRQTEILLPLAGVAEPQAPILAAQVGQRVSAEGSFAPEDFSVLAERYHGGRNGYWVVGRLDVQSASGPAAVAVALGWTDSLERARAEATAASASLPGPVRVEGRYAGTEAPVAPETGPASTAVPTTMSVAAFVNTWQDLPADADVYGGYIIAGEAPAPLETIEAGPPEQAVELNWLNVFYAIEWTVFAGFAVFLWYRLARDAWERETERALEARIESEHGSGTETG